MGAQTDLITRLVTGSPVIVIATCSGDYVDRVVEVLKISIFGSRIRIVETPRSVPTEPGGGWAAIVARDGMHRDHRFDVPDPIIAMALPLPVPIVGIAPDPARHLPRDLVRAAEYRIELPRLDARAIELVVEAVSGGRPTRRVDPALLRFVEISDLAIAFRGASSPDECIAGVARIAAKAAQVLRPGPTLQELHGYGEAKEWGLALISDLHAYRSGRIGWDDLDNRGLLLTGASGVGKTMFAEALARSAEVPLIATSVAQWNAAGYLSQTLQAVRSFFDKAAAQAPCIMFIDELDGISDRATIRGDHVEYWTQIVNLLLELLAGVEKRAGIVVVAATNFPEKIDPAVKRAGRLDRQIRIPKPDSETLARIFRHHLGPKALVDVPMLPLALAARGSTGADVEAFVRRAKGTARRSCRPLERDDVLIEIRRRRPPLSDVARHRLAVHEAGHAVVHAKLRRGVVLGVSLFDDGGETEVEETVSGDATLAELEDLLATLLAGRVAEEIEFGSGSIGVGFGPNSDLARATAIARDIEVRYGIGRFGLVHLESTALEMSAVAGLFQAVSDRLRAASERAGTVLREEWAAHVALTDVLRVDSHVSGEAIVRLLGNVEHPSAANLKALDSSTADSTSK